MSSGGPPRPEYWVYENYPNNKAVGHMSACHFFKQWGGKAVGSGYWHGPFDSKQAAKSVGQSLGRKTFHWCGRCG